MIFERQEYQQECIEHIMTLLENFDFKEPSTSNLKECFMEFYSNHPCPIKTLSDKFNVDILMETGTGKTFTYLNLIFELHRKYKQNKFIIFVPRKAILESIKQNIELTKDYFYNEFKKHLKSYFYSDSKSQSSIINHYIKNTDELSVLILTNSAIDKEKNILNQSSELFKLKSIFENIIALKPISIIDEPHLLKGEAFHQYFSKIQNLYFRFGATFPDKTHSLSNLVYCLDSIQAFNQYLVKQVSVHTLFEDNLEPKLIKIEAKNKKALFSYHLDNIGYIKEVSCKEDLGQALNYPPYNGVEILNFKGQKAFLSNNTHLEIHKQSYTLNQSEIIFIESRNRKAAIHTTKNTLEVYAVMNELQKELGNSFYRCHRGYLVNMAHITEYSNDMIEMDNGERVYLAKEKYQKFVREYMRYLRNGGTAYE